jgi:hypothetical protein
MSKQERIRLNHQRSRARKKEHILGLQKYIEDNHSEYREAKLQLESCQQLREENQKLRALLGVSDTQIDTLVNAHALDHATEQTSSRNVHPNLQPEAISAQAALSACLDAAGDQILLTAASTSSPLVLSGSNSDTNEPYLTSSSAFEFQQPQYYFNHTIPATPNNSTLCSEAHELINQENTTSQDIRHIGSRLAFGFGPEIQGLLGK